MSYESSTPLLPSPQAPGSFNNEEARWDYTQSARDLVDARRLTERQTGNIERPTIGRDTPLVGGVYEGTYGGEAILVDYDQAPEPIDIAVAKTISRARDPQTGEIDKSRILDGVFAVVSDTMKYDSAAVDAIFQRTLQGKDGAQISLNYYIGSGVGECRHQALFAATILERLSQQGIVRGKASIDRNMVKSGPDGKYDGHAWVRYTNSGGEVFIIDVAQQKIGSLEELMVAHTENPSTSWDYARPEDKRAQEPYDPSLYMNDQGIIDRVPWNIGATDSQSAASPPVQPEEVKKTRSELLAELTKSLSVEEQNTLRAYADSLAAKRRAQQNSEGDNSRYWDQAAGQYYRQLSPEARAISAQYAYLLNGS